MSRASGHCRTCAEDGEYHRFNFTSESLRPSPPTPLWQQSWGWIVETIRRAGIPAEVGFGLQRVFLDAGLPEPELRLESVVAGGPESVDYEWMAETVRSMLPLMVTFGVATDAGGRHRHPGQPAAG